MGSQINRENEVDWQGSSLIRTVHYQPPEVLVPMTMPRTPSIISQSAFHFFWKRSYGLPQQHRPWIRYGIFDVERRSCELLVPRVTTTPPVFRSATLGRLMGCVLLQSRAFSSAVLPSTHDGHGHNAAPLKVDGEEIPMDKRPYPSEKMFGQMSVWRGPSECNS